MQTLCQTVLKCAKVGQSMLNCAQPGMNREIASAPEKSEADFCVRRTAAVSRQRCRTVHTPPDWLLKRVYGVERGKREKTARRLGACTLNRALAVSVCIIKIFDRAAIVRPLGRCRIVAGEVTELTDFLTQNY